jgi:hypothetical protein
MAEDFDTLAAGWELLPDDEIDIDPDAELADAFRIEPDAGEIDQALEPPQPLPLGRSWMFDPVAGRFAVAGGSPIETRGVESVKAWIICLLYTMRGAHPVLDPDYGIDNPFAMIGKPEAEISNQQYQDEVTAALLRDDRIAAVSAFTFEHEAGSDTTVVRFIVQLRYSDDTIPIGVPLG